MMMKVKGRWQLVEEGEAEEDGAGRKKQVNKTSTIKKKAGQMADATNGDGEDSAKKKTHTPTEQKKKESLPRACQILYTLTAFLFTFDCSYASYNLDKQTDRGTEGQADRYE